MKPTFTLNDIPNDWWIRLNDKLVDELDQLNRPYKYGLSKRRIARYWEAGELHRRTLDNMTEEEKAGYKRRHSFFEKLWGRHRFKDYHYPKDDPRRYVNTGPWIEKSEIPVLREGIEIDQANLNKAITGFRAGKFSDNVREMRFKQLPILADENWAWVLGFYYAAGNMYLYEREGYESLYIRVRVPEPVLPKFLSVTNQLGMQAVTYELKKKYRGEGRGKIGVGTSEQIVFGWPEFLVLRKFGLNDAILNEVDDREERQLAAANYKPIIPEWILNDDNCMRNFIEAYISTGKCRSSLQVATQSGGRKLPALHVRIMNQGYPREYVKKFLQEIHLWFYRQGALPGGFHETPPTGENRVQYSIGFSELEAMKFFRDTFSLHKPELKARIYVRLEADEDPVIYEALRRYGNPENVILGCLLEQPMSVEDITYDLRMYDEAAEEALSNLVGAGLIAKDNGDYVYEPKQFIAETITEYKDIAEEKRQRIQEYSEQLLYQCELCREVYIKETETCELCGGEIHPVFRKNILKRLDTTSKYDLILANKLEAEQ